METKDKNRRNGNFDPKGRNLDQDPASIAAENNKARKKTDGDRPLKSQTFNEDEDSWERRNNAETKNNGTPRNDWNENDPMERDKDYRYDDEQRDMSAGDYINIDHSEYNRGNSRYGWYEPEE